MSENLGAGDLAGEVVAAPDRHGADSIAPEPRRPAGERTSRVGFVVDVVGYGERSLLAQEHLQTRLQALLRHVVADVGGDLDEVDHDSGAGDGLVVFLPTGADPTRLVPELLRSAAERLTADNVLHSDRIRLRMAVGSGVVRPGGNGFAGPLVVNVSRLVDSVPLRRAARENPDSDLVVLVLDAVHRDVIGPGYVPLSVDRFQVVDVAMKEFAEQAWLWVSTTQGR